MIHAEYGAIFKKLEEDQIRFCLLRDELNHGRLLRDLDLLVESSKFETVIQILMRLGYVLRTTEKQQPHKSVLVRLTPDGFVVIDLHRTVVQSAIVLMDGDKVISRMPSDDKAHLPSRGDLLVMLLLHNIIGKNEIQEKHVVQLRELLTEVDISSFGAIVGDDGLADTLIEVADDLDRYYSDPVLVKRAKKKLTQRYWEIDGRARWSYYHFKLRRLLQRYRIRQRAPLYVLTGVDGAGKSSLAREMKEVLNRPGGYSAKIIYMGPWGHYKLKWTSGELFSPGWSVDSKEWLTCMLGRGSGPKTSTIVALRIAFKMLLRKQLTETEQWQHESLRQHSRLFVTLRFARSVFSAARFATMIFVEMYYRYYLAYRYRRIGVTVIADRYIYDLMTGRMHEIIPQYRTLRSFLCSIFPRPTRGFFVTNDAATILSRKADLSQEMLPKHLRLYEDLAQKYGFEEVVSDRPARDIAYDIISRHLEEIANYSRL